MHCFPCSQSLGNFKTELCLLYSSYQGKPQLQSLSQEKWKMNALTLAYIMIECHCQGLVEVPNGFPGPSTSCTQHLCLPWKNRNRESQKQQHIPAFLGFHACCALHLCSSHSRWLNPLFPCWVSRELEKVLTHSDSSLHLWEGSQMDGEMAWRMQEFAVFAGDWINFSAPHQAVHRHLGL